MSKAYKSRTKTDEIFNSYDFLPLTKTAQDTINTEHFEKVARRRPIHINMCTKNAHPVKLFMNHSNTQRPEMEKKNYTTFLRRPVTL